MVPPPSRNWSAQWHEILHEWNMRVDYWARASGISSWSKKCVTQYQNFASYIANIPANPSCGRPQHAWNPKLEMFCRYTTLGNWEIVAGNAVRWAALLPRFLIFVPCTCCYHVIGETPVGCTVSGVSIYFIFPPPPLHWVRLRALVLTWLDL